MNSQTNSKTGLLLVNLGTPNSTELKDIKLYLKQFLSDPYVIDIPAPLRWLLVNGIILNFRPKKSQHAYKSIWTDKGSPLLSISLELEKEVQEKIKIQGLHWITATGMRYGEPSIFSALQKLLNSGANEIIFLPLYPQYALSSTTTAEKEVFTALEILRPKNHPIIHNGALYPFYRHQTFLSALSDSILKAVSLDSFDHLLFSYHGLPERHVLKTDLSQKLCLKNTDCCNEITDKNSFCYRAHCFSTTNEVVKKISLPKEKVSLAFQSRLGRTPWIQPFADQEIIRLAQSGVKRLAVICPSFVTDCLETLEEINIRGRELFLENGGKEFIYIPCLNTDEKWVSAILEIAQEIQKKATKNSWSPFLD